MGSFRSQPDLVKHSVSKNGANNITYAVTHMCGNSILIQVGESIWKTHISTSPPSKTQKIQFSEYSTDMVVQFERFRSLSVHFCGTPFYLGTVG